jgi:alanine racemase
MPRTIRQALATPRISPADTPLQLREDAQGGGVQRVVATLGANVWARCFQVSRNAEGRRLRIALEREMRCVDLPDPREAEQLLAEECCGLYG